MRFQLRKCNSCLKYSLKDHCPFCKGETRTAHPAKYSPDDKYIRYRLAENYNSEN